MTKTNNYNQMKTTMKKIHNNITKRFKLVTTILLSSSMLATVTAAEQPILYKMESKILLSKDMLLPDAKELKEGSIGDDEALRKWAIRWSAQKGVDIMSLPSIAAPEDEKSVIRIQSKVEYFERTKDGNFALKSLPEDESAGVRLNYTAKAADKGSVSVDIALQINTLSDREKISEVSLDVGRPVMETQKVQTKVTMPFGQWRWIATQKLQDIDSGKHEHLLILFKVTPIDKD